MPPQRAELILEALQLREFGMTQQMIAKTLKIPQQTISDWLKTFGKDTSESVGKDNNITDIRTNTLTEIKPHPLTLYPCKYEDAQLPENYFDLIVSGQDSRKAAHDHFHRPLFVP